MRLACLHPTAAYLKRLSERDPVTFELEVSFLRRQLPRKRKAVRTRWHVYDGSVIPGGPGRSAGEKVATMFIGASLDGVEALAAGKSGEPALVSAALGVAGGLIGDAGGDAIERFVKTPNGRRLLAKSAAVHRIPLTVPISRKARDVVGRGKIASAVINKYMVNAPIDALKGRIVDSMVKPGQKKAAHVAAVGFR